MRYIILLVLLTGCAKMDGKNDSRAKDLFSSWTGETSGTTLDLRNMVFGQQPITIAFSASSGCNCTIDIVGSQDSGTATLFSCTQYGPTNYCGGIGTTIYSYTNSYSGVLELCSSGCENYR